MARVLIRIDRNGTKYWSDDTCRRCGGEGGRSDWAYTGYTCYECGGTGRSKPHLEKEYTPEYAAKLEAKRLAKWEAEEAKRRAEQAERDRIEAEKRAKEEAERKAEEERIKALKARSNYVGTAGEKLTATVTYEGSPYYERRGFGGYGTERVYIHRFRDADGNLIIWRSCSGFPILNANEGETFTVTGTVKEHSEYKGEKQTFILRAKVKRPA